MSASTSRSNSGTSTPRRFPTAHNGRPESSFGAAFTTSQEWWEHVLPPGQLAERLRKAQRSSSASRRRNNPALANATPSERSAWKRLSGIPDAQSDHAPSRRQSLHEPPTWHAAPIRHSAPSSSHHSPELTSSPWPKVTASPFSSPPMSRSTSTRRCRISGEDPTTITTQQISVSRSVYIASQYANEATNVESGSLPITPELSSDDADCQGKSKSRLAGRSQGSTVHTSSLSQPPTILRFSSDIPNLSKLTTSDEESPLTRPRRDQHVSFDDNCRTAESLKNSRSAFDVPSLNRRDSGSSFETSLPRSSGARRARQGVRINGHKANSFSLPGSRRNSLNEDPHFLSGHAAADYRYASRASAPDAALLDSLNGAHKQLSSAGHLALNLTRQLTVPLRPVFHMTLFFSVSSITLASLACFLFASYLLTAWDDVSQRSQTVTRVASETKTKVETSLGWGIRLLDGGKRSHKSTRHSRTQSEPVDRTSTEVPGVKASKVVFWPMRVALTSAGSVAYLFTPSAVSDLFVTPKSDPASDRPFKPAASARTGDRKSTSSLPPRPPLSLLLPSIMFTLVIAVGASLASFFASRRAAGDASFHPSSTSRSTSPNAAHNYSNNGRSSTFVHMPTSYSTSSQASPAIGRPNKRGSSRPQSAI